MMISGKIAEERITNCQLIIFSRTPTAPEPIERPILDIAIKRVNWVAAISFQLNFIDAENMPIVENTVKR